MKIDLRVTSHKVIQIITMYYLYFKDPMFLSTTVIYDKKSFCPKAFLLAMYSCDKCK